MQNELNAESLSDNLSRWDLIRDIALLQVKLVVDGFRDLLLVPISLVVGLVSLVTGGRRPGNEFYELLRLGKRSDKWINLFGAAERVPVDSLQDRPLPVGDIDEMMTRVESFIVEEYKTGGVTKQAKDRLDQALDVMHRRVRKQHRDDAAQS